MYPHTLAPTEAQIATVLAAAVRAPSAHNTQPWRFRVRAGRIDVLADRTRSLPIADPEMRELRIACGAALFNMRLALAREELEARVAVQADRADDVLGRIDIVGRRTSAALSATPPGDDELYRAIEQRRTNRKPFLEQSVDLADRRALVDAAHGERARLELVTEPEQLAAMHRLLVAAHARQIADPAWAAEFAEWVGRAAAERDGIAVASSGPAPEPQDMWALRDFGLGRAAERVPGKDFESQPLLVVLCSYTDDAAARVQAGQALQRVLLTATSRGLAASFISQLTEDGAARASLRELLGSRVFPQVVMRIGYGSPVPATPRRPLSDVLVVDRVLTSD